MQKETLPRPIKIVSDPPRYRGDRDVWRSSLHAFRRRRPRPSRQRLLSHRFIRRPPLDVDSETASLQASLHREVPNLTLMPPMQVGRGSPAHNPQSRRAILR